MWDKDTIAYWNMAQNRRDPAYPTPTELWTLQFENNQLRKRISELEAELERRCQSASK